MASTRSFSRRYLLIWLSPLVVLPENRGEPFVIIAALPTPFCILATACCINSNCISLVAGRPAGNLPSLPFLCSLRTAFSTPSPASLPPQASPNGGLAITNRMAVSSKQSSFMVSANRMFSAAWFLISISARQIA